MIQWLVMLRSVFLFVMLVVGSTACRAADDSAAPTDAGRTGPELDGSSSMCGAGRGTDLYDRRIDPLFRDDQPSTCNQCHLSGISLRQYVRASPCETFACLVDEGIVDTQSPQDSLVLKWIRRAEPDSELITKAVIDAEYDAFSQWITYNSECDDCAGVSCPDSADSGVFCRSDTSFMLDGGGIPSGDCSKEAIASTFRATVYKSRGRCSPCHINEGDNDKFGAPLWIEVQPDCATASRRTMNNVLRAGYIDVDEPENSLLLLKPLPEDLGGVVHGGHDKFDSFEDVGYQSFLAFIEHLASCETQSDGGP